MHRVLVSQGGDRRSLDLSPGETAVVGSAADNDLVAPYPGVSRHHARLEVTADGVLAVDLGSKNGLVCDGLRYENLLLTPGRQVLLGRAVLEVEEISPSDLELALELEGPSPPTIAGDPTAAAGAGAAEPGDSPPTQETRALRELDTSSPGPALRLVRHLSRPGAGSDLPAALDRARTVLGARWLAALEMDGGSGDLTTAAWSGPAVPGDELDPLEAALASEPPGRGDLTRVELPSALVVAARAPGRGWLAAAFSPPLRPEPWAEELLSFLAERLLGNGDELAPGTGHEALGEELDFPPGMVIGPSIAMQDLLRQLRATVRSDLPVLVTGETGAGKELVARLIHRSSPKSAGPFVAINCAAIPGELLEAELFGVAARVATGVDPRPGLFLTAHGGTLFLDEIGDMPPRLQVKLLRVLQEHEVWPVGRSHPEPVDVRVLAASNRDLDIEVEAGRFRRDLFYRLGGLRLHVPPLRHRRDDLPALIHRFASRCAAKYEKRIVGVTRPALALLMDHRWPGNVRELEHEMERAVLLCPHGGALEPGHFPGLPSGAGGPEPAGGPEDTDAVEAVGGGSPGVPAPRDSDAGAGAGAGEVADRAGGRAAGTQSFRPLQERLDEVERVAIREALGRTGGVKAQAARLLGITRNGLALKMKRLGLEPDGNPVRGQGEKAAPGSASD